MKLKLNVMALILLVGSKLFLVSEPESTSSLTRCRPLVTSENHIG